MAPEQAFIVHIGAVALARPGVRKRKNVLFRPTRPPLWGKCREKKNIEWPFPFAISFLHFRSRGAEGGPPQQWAAVHAALYKQEMMRKRTLPSRQRASATPAKRRRTLADQGTTKLSHPIDDENHTKWANLPHELVYHILNGTDSRSGRHLLHPRWRCVARSVCRIWQHTVESPTPVDATRMVQYLADPRTDMRRKWVHGRLLCASTVALLMRRSVSTLAPTPESVGPHDDDDGRAANVRDAGRLNAIIKWIDAYMLCVPLEAHHTVAVMVAAGTDESTQAAFRHSMGRDAIASLRTWVQRDRRRWSEDIVDLYQMLPSHGDDVDDAKHKCIRGPDTWWVHACDGGAAYQPWSTIKRKVGRCPSAALSAIMLRVAARWNNRDALHRLVALGETPPDVCEAVFDAACAGHTTFVASLLERLSVATSDASCCVSALSAHHHAWLGAASTGQTQLMRSLAKSSQELLHIAKRRRGARGRIAARLGGPLARHYDETVCRAALLTDRYEYLQVMGPSIVASISTPPVASPSERAFHLGAQRIDASSDPGNVFGDKAPSDPLENGRRLLDHLIVEALSLSALDVARWLVCSALFPPDGRDLVDDRALAATIADNGTPVVSEQRLQHAIVAMVSRGRGIRDHPQRVFEWMRDVLGARPSGVTLEVLLSHIERFEWSHSGDRVSALYTGNRYARALDALASIVCAWPHTALAKARIGNGAKSIAFGDALVQRLVQRVSGQRMPGDRDGRHHARRKALATLDRLALLHGTRGELECCDPWTAASKWTQHAIEGLRSSSSSSLPWNISSQSDVQLAVMVSPARAIDRTLGAIEIACRCLGPRIDPDRLPATVGARLAHLGERDGPPDSKRVSHWRRWCGLSASGDDPNDETTLAMAMRIDGWIREIGLCDVFAS